ncbi:hypothetical protein PCANC_18758 [Puccinia coronata f. sp. avenae]|uniref:Fatty acid hydroxylase domain-containing protein n=1 Tax=Puccinia coronata f. sp. avenae TaxID=200324 RepID=A0A2N5UED7_9BASI|nr:hypothetical protein PCANC_18758 [Puccinia coronata f. sp. avenae]
MLGCSTIELLPRCEAPSNILQRDYLTEIHAYAPPVSQLINILLPPQHARWVLLNYGQALTQLAYWWGLPILQFLWASFVLDTWQYFWHQAFHMNQFLYKHIHSVHHRLYCPYSFGALYNHLLEGFILDTLGAVIAHWASAMSVRQATLLFGISTAKTVDNHCGLALPFDPLQHLFGNNAVYHDIHHQQFGIKKNFSQTYFVHWDVLMGTHMTSAEADARRAKISGVQRPATAAAAMPSPLLSLSLSVPASLSLLDSSEDSNMDYKASTSLKLKTRKIPLPTTRLVGQNIPLPTGVVGRKIPLPAGLPLPKKTQRNGSSRTKIIKADKPTGNPPDASRPSPTIQFQGGYGRPSVATTSPSLLPANCCLPPLATASCRPLDPAEAPDSPLLPSGHRLLPLATAAPSCRPLDPAEAPDSPLLPSGHCLPPLATASPSCRPLDPAEAPDSPLLPSGHRLPPLATAAPSCRPLDPAEAPDLPLLPSGHRLPPLATASCHPLDPAEAPNLPLLRITLPFYLSCDLFQWY